MSRRGLGDGVIVKRLREKRSLIEETLEAAGELVAETIEVIRTKLVDRDLNDERRLGLSGGSGW